MSTIFSYPYGDFSAHTGLLTISTGPVVVNQVGDRVLLHVSSSSLKYQFIGGRLDDTLSFRDNALMRAQEVVRNNQILLTDDEPLILMDSISRDGVSEKIVLVHYKAHIESEAHTLDAEWFSLADIIDLHEHDQTSSPNILIASRHFLPL